MVNYIVDECAFINIFYALNRNYSLLKTLKIIEIENYNLRNEGYRYGKKSCCNR